MKIRIAELVINLEAKLYSEVNNSLIKLTYNTYKYLPLLIFTFQPRSAEESLVVSESNTLERLDPGATHLCEDPPD